MQKKVEMVKVWQEKNEIWENMETPIYLPDYGYMADISEAVYSAAVDESYTADLAETVKEHECLMNDIIQEYGFTSLQDAAYWTMERYYTEQFWNENADAFKVYALWYIYNRLNLEEIPAEVWEKIAENIEDCADRFDRFWEIEDVVDDAIREYQEKQEEAEDFIVAAM